MGIIIMAFVRSHSKLFDFSVCASLQSNDSLMTREQPGCLAILSQILVLTFQGGRAEAHSSSQGPYRR